MIVPLPFDVFCRETIADAIDDPDDERLLALTKALAGDPTPLPQTIAEKAYRRYPRDVETYGDLRNAVRKYSK